MPEMPESDRSRDLESSVHPARPSRVQGALDYLAHYCALADLGSDLIRQGKSVRAAAMLSQALRMNANDAETFVARAVAYALQGELALARADLDRALELHPSFAPALEERGLVRLRLGDLAGARTDLDLAIEHGPSARLYLDRGIVSQAMGDPQGAASDLTTSIGLDPDLACSWAARAFLRVTQGDQVGAVADLGKGLEVARGTDRPLVRRMLATLGHLAEKGALGAEDYAAAVVRFGGDTRVTGRNRSVSSATNLAHRPRLPRRAVVALAPLLASAMVFALVWPGGGVDSPYSPESKPRALDAPHQALAIESTRPPVSFPEVDYELFVSVGAMTSREAEEQARLDAALRGRTVEGPGKED